MKLTKSDNKSDGIRWDKKVGFNFWDADDLIFLIDKQALLTGNFDSVFSCIETG
jgi:hypothetical protein